MAKKDLPKTSAPRNSGCNTSNTSGHKLEAMGVKADGMFKPSPKTGV